MQACVRSKAPAIRPPTAIANRAFLFPNGNGAESKPRVEWLGGALNQFLFITRPSSATADGGEHGKHWERFHKIKSGDRDGQRLAAAIG